VGHLPVTTIGYNCVTAHCIHKTRLMFRHIDKFVSPRRLQRIEAKRPFSPSGEGAVLNSGSSVKAL